MTYQIQVQIEGKVAKELGIIRKAIISKERGLIRGSEPIRCNKAPRRKCSLHADARLNV